MTVEAKPFLKWAGGKRSLMRELLGLVPKEFGSYYEPFLGGGALFFALANQGRIRRAYLNDANVRLMRTYAAVRDDPASVIKKLRRMPNEIGYYLRTRAKAADTLTDASVAAWMIYLNRTCFNGLYRVNGSGVFNVPFANYKAPLIADEVNLHVVSRALTRVRLGHRDFAAACAKAKAGDFVYFDPPYLPRRDKGKGAEFAQYTPGGFDFDDHVRLRDLALALKRRGVYVLISNSGVEAVADLYADGFEIREVMGQRNVGASGERRGRVLDYLIR